MASVLNVLLPIFGLILAGYLCLRGKRFGPTAAAELNRFVVWLCLPALLFESTATASWSALWNPRFVAISVLGTIGLFVATVGWRLYEGRALADAGIDGLSAAYANTGYIGIPLCLLVFGDPGLKPALIATLVVVCVLFAVAVVLVEIGLQGEPRPLAAFAKVLLALARNPLVAAPILGGLWASTGLGVAPAAAKFLHLLGAATTPCALVSLGAFLAERHQGSTQGVGALVVLKLIVHPAITAILAFWVFDLPPLWAESALLLSALPTGTGPYMLAEFYRRDASVVSRTILITTLGSLPTLSICLYFMNG